jgi:hypothetical protein
MRDPFLIVASEDASVSPPLGLVDAIEERRCWGCFKIGGSSADTRTGVAGNSQSRFPSHIFAQSVPGVMNDIRNQSVSRGTHGGKERKGK